MQTQTQRGLMIRFASFIVDGFGAPHLSGLTKCGAPEMEEPKAYVGSLFLNGLLGMQYVDTPKRLTVMFGRRADHAMREYRTGRELLVSYLQRLPYGNNHFLVALRATTHFEQCIGSASQAATLLDRLLDNADARDYCMPPDLRCCEERLRKIWNRSKHFDEDIMSHNTAAADIVAPVWLTNTGISSEKVTVSWEELCSVLTKQHDALKFFCEDAPRNFVKKQRPTNQGDADEEREPQ